MSGKNELTSHSHSLISQPVIIIKIISFHLKIKSEKNKSIKCFCKCTHPMMKITIINGINNVMMRNNNNHNLLIIYTQ